MYIQFGTQVFVPPPPQCARCKGVATLQTQDAVLWCRNCLDAEIRRQQAHRSRSAIGEVLELCPAAARARLYKALAIAFHPDTGGSTDIMTELNAAKERLGL